jgi:YHS domain-containing protein
VWAEVMFQSIGLWCGLIDDPDLERMTIDPVCGMSVAQNQGPHYRHEGTTWWFCSTQCRDEFAADPEKFVRDGTSTLR